jgi:predicted transcriptional regulator
MAMTESISRSELLGLTGEIVMAQLSNNAIGRDELPALIQSVFDKLKALSADDADPADTAPTPAVPIRKSVTDEYLICLEDGKKMKMLKRHLMTAYGMSPEEYRARWGLKPDYPMVAPAYARKRQDLAKKIGLGRKPRIAVAPPETKPASRRTRSKRTAA